MADATPLGQMLSSTDHNKNYTTIQVYIHGQVLNNVNSAKYLSLKIHITLSWDVHINKVIHKAHNTLPLSNRNSRWPKNIKAQCYSTLARSPLEYAFTN
jgi:hypothetical protein